MTLTPYVQWNVAVVAGQSSQSKVEVWNFFKLSLRHSRTSSSNSTSSSASSMAAHALQQVYHFEMDFDLPISIPIFQPTPCSSTSDSSRSGPFSIFDFSYQWNLICILPQLFWTLCLMQHSRFIWFLLFYFLSGKEKRVPNRTKPTVPAYRVQPISLRIAVKRLHLFTNHFRRSRTISQPMQV